MGMPQDVIWEGERAPLAKAFIAAQKSMDVVKKAATNPAFRSKYADLAAVVEAIVPALNEQGVGMLQFVAADEAGVHVTTTFLHESGASVSSTLTMRPSKDDPQGRGSATTYARRYALLAMAGAAPDDDDDGNAASEPQRGRQTPARPAPKEVLRDQLEASVELLQGEGEDFPGIEPGSGKTAYFARKDGDDKLFKEISAEIVTLESPAAVAAFLNGRTATIATFPENWRKQLRAELEEQKQAIRDNVANEEGEFRPNGQGNMAGRRSAPEAVTP